MQWSWLCLQLGQQPAQVGEQQFGRMGMTTEDLLNSVKPPDPIFAEDIPIVAAAVSDGTRRLVQRIKANLTVRRNTRNGNSAAEHLIAALRCLYRHAVNDELIDERSNPAAKVPKPRRQPCGVPKRGPMV